MSRKENCESHIREIEHNIITAPPIQMASIRRGNIIWKGRLSYYRDQQEQRLGSYSTGRKMGYGPDLDKIMTAYLIIS